MLPAIFFYDVVVFVHVTAIVVAFGVIFAYPILIPFLKTNHPRAMAAVHEGQGRIGQFVISPAGGIALLAGLYLAQDRDYMGEVWVIVPLLILLGLLTLGGVFFKNADEKAIELARRDIDAAGDGPVVWSAEYEAHFARLENAGRIAAGLVLVALFFMTAKPFA